MNPFGLILLGLAAVGGMLLLKPEAKAEPVPEPKPPVKSKAKESKEEPPPTE